MAQPGGAGTDLRCQRCARERPAVCQACGSGALRAARTGVTKLAEDLEALARLPVGVVTAEVDELPATPVLAGTDAVLHRVGPAGVEVGAVVFVEFDAELSAPRYRAPEEALAALAGVSVVGGRGSAGAGRGAGRVLVQTRQPGHPVLQAALRGRSGAAGRTGAGRAPGAGPASGDGAGRAVGRRRRHRRRGRRPRRPRGRRGPRAHGGPLAGPGA